MSSIASPSAHAATQDAIPGLHPRSFTPKQVGNYLITCAQLCGNGHSTMRGVLRVVTPEDYSAFLQSQAGQAGSASNAGYE
jgi:cytochrome c oxidase subunit 2